MKTDSIGDRIGDLVQKAVAAFFVVAVVGGLLHTAGVTWDRSPLTLGLMAAFWLGVIAVWASQRRP
jgi:hypothetical protein